VGGFDSRRIRIFHIRFEKKFSFCKSYEKRRRHPSDSFLNTEAPLFWVLFLIQDLIYLRDAKRLNIEY
jgi:hypothetical protein